MIISLSRSVYSGFGLNKNHAHFCVPLNKVAAYFAFLSTMSNLYFSPKINSV